MEYKFYNFSSSFKLFSFENFLFLSILFLTLSYYLAWGWQEQIVYSLFPVGFLLNLYNQENLFPKLTLNLVLIIFLIVIISSSSLWSENQGKYFLKSLRYGITILFALFCFFYCFGKSDLDRKLETFFIAIISASSLVVLLSLFFNSYEPGVDRLTHFSFTGITNNPNNSGLYIAVSSLLILYFLRKNDNAKLFALLAIILVFHFIFMLLTKSRGAIIFFSICYLLQLLLTKSKSLRQDIIINAPILLGALTFFIIFSSDINNRLNEPYYRFELIQHGLEIIKNNFWFGDGLNYDFKIQVADGTTFSKIHNSFLQVFQNAGIFGFLGFFVVTTRIIFFGLKNSNDRVKIIALWLLLGIMYMAVDGGIPISRPGKLWFNFWIPVFILMAIEFRLKKI